MSEVTSGDHNPWICPSTATTGILLVDTIWLGGLTYYVVTRNSELSERIDKLEAENKIHKKRVADLKAQVVSTKLIQNTLEDHDERIDMKADKKELTETLELLDEYMNSVDMDVDTRKKPKSKFKAKIIPKKRDTKKKHKYVSSSDESDESHTSSLSSELDSESVVDMEEMYGTLDLDIDVKKCKPVKKSSEKSRREKKKASK